MNDDVETTIHARCIALKRNDPDDALEAFPAYGSLELGARDVRTPGRIDRPSDDVEADFRCGQRLLDAPGRSDEIEVTLPPRVGAYETHRQRPRFRRCHPREARQPIRVARPRLESAEVDGIVDDLGVELGGNLSQVFRNGVRIRDHDRSTREST